MSNKLLLRIFVGKKNVHGKNNSPKAGNGSPYGVRVCIKESTRRLLGMHHVYFLTPQLLNLMMHLVALSEHLASSDLESVLHMACLIFPDYFARRWGCQGAFGMEISRQVANPHWHRNDSKCTSPSLIYHLQNDRLYFWQGLVCVLTVVSPRVFLPSRMSDGWNDCRVGMCLGLWLGAGLWSVVCFDWNLGFLLIFFAEGWTINQCICFFDFTLNDVHGQFFQAVFHTPCVCHGPKWTWHPSSTARFVVPCVQYSDTFGTDPFRPPKPIATCSSIWLTLANSCFTICSKF